MTRAYLLLFCIVVAGLSHRAHGQEPEISTDRPTYLPGEPIRVRFKNGPGNLLDWIGLYKEFSPGGNFVVWNYLDGSVTGLAPLSSGELVFPKGMTNTGNFEARMYENDQYALLADTTFVVTNSPRVLMAKRAFVPGETISVHFTNAPANAKAWAGLFQSDAPDSAPLARLYLDGTTNGAAVKTNGTLAFTLGAGSGRYEARLFANDSNALLDRLSFVLEYPRPVVAAFPSDGSVTLKWQAPAWPIPIEKYVVLASATAGGTLGMLGEINARPGENTFTHNAQPNGKEICYLVRAVGANGQATSESDLLCTAPFAMDSGEFVAYEVAPATAGQQAWNGSLGMEFELVNGISISRLGVFDDRSDGLKARITARIYDRTSRRALASVEFTPDNPGVLIGGSRFKSLPSPLALAAGFKGVIVAEGYGAEERAGNSALGSSTWKSNDGNGSLVFVGRSRFGRNDAYPETVDKGPANRYAAGTFVFRVTEVRAPGKPTVTAVPDNAAVTLTWPPVTSPLPAARYRIFRGSSETGSFSQVAEITATEYRDAGLKNGQEVCYKVRAVSEAGVLGPESEVVCQVPDAPAAGVAYINPAGIEGNQSYGGSVGNDFDVVRPIRVTRLGAFDDASDGLKRPISVRIYNRATEKELAKVIFTSNDPGELIGGSRFKTLPQAIALPIGFEGAIVASGYGEDERVGNQGIPGIWDLKLEMFTGGCLRFVGRSRFGDDPDAFPPILDGGPANRYAAGTFYFEPDNAGPKLVIAATTSGRIAITWAGAGILESAGAVTGPWQPMPGAVSGIQINPTERTRFYRIRL